jgi:hypothetical protein
MSFIKQCVERLVTAAERAIDSHRKQSFAERADNLVRVLEAGKAAGVKRIHEGSFMGPSLTISFDGDSQAADKKPDIV